MVSVTESVKKGGASKVVGRWSSRFVWAAIIQGLIATILGIILTTALISPLPDMFVEVFLDVPLIGFVELTALQGFGIYIVVGVIAVGLTAWFYYYFEVVMEKTYSGVANILTWIHLVLMNVGVAAASWMMVYAGFIGDLALFPIDQGGMGMTIDQVAEQILAPFLVPIGAMFLVACIGILAGIIGFIITYFKS
ncbi:MAG: hypothetical protein H3Z50_04395 [archaeon]|nr:hypothetical protein [archaeon]MCP8305665.1 hypothetical protein [archaeon]